MIIVFKFIEFSFAKNIDFSFQSFFSNQIMFSFRKSLQVRANLRELSLSLWGMSKSFIVVFKEPRSAAIAAQAQLSSTPFSMMAEGAPPVTDIQWAAVTRPLVDKTSAVWVGDAVYLFMMATFSATNLGLQKGIEWFNPSNTLAAQTYMIIFIIIFIQFRPRGIIALKGRAAGD